MAIADLFCGAGGTSTGAVEAIESLGYRAQLTAINHWQVAVATHEQNHPSARHLCASLDALNPRELFKPGELQILWASPECTHHSVARGGKPINDQSRSTAWCVTRWAEALLPPIILVENVPEFRTWGPIGSDGRPLKSKKGATFEAWLNTLRSLGYAVDYRVLVAADYGDPTTRRRLFVQAVRGRRVVTFPNPTHASTAKTDLLSSRRSWRTARSDVIDWSLPGQSIYERKRPLSKKTLNRIFSGLQKFSLRPFITPGNGERATQAPRTHDVDSPLPTVAASGHLHLAQPFLICMEHKGSIRSIDRPMPTVTTAKGGAIALANPFLVHAAHGGPRRARSVDEPMPTVAGNRGDVALCEPSLLPQGGGGVLRSVDLPTPTIHCAGAVGLVEPFLIEYYGNGQARSLEKPIGTVTTHERFGLVRPTVILNGERYLLDIRFRMLQPHELAAAQGFRSDYRFTGTKTEQVKQIGNAVPRRLARAIVLAAVSQNADVSEQMQLADAA